MWNEAVFVKTWVGDREITPLGYQELFASTHSDTSSSWVNLVAPAGLVPTVAIPAIRFG
jgi:hypothetical protein